ncbi:NAD(P)-dependent oxidoreductase [Tunicatimonas pelagia]|uniref:NAD(P)-dependent oxidoreductase n=1 Tax=Tunicatimonas pelagia TaxID=931531 RepID=UPI0026669008|nr:NAD(P)-dependent oxidoreductase [Tunicatimonas pelagia]WKN42409.1 NAD(P)-dependent oxidoreductase [Tunicatimonas pelagia]
MKKITQDTKIGWIGTGVMGAAMVNRLQAAGYSCIVYNRTQEKAEVALNKGAVWADTPKAVAEQSDVVFTIVGFPQDVREVYLGKNGVLAGAKEGSILVDMTTTEPSLAQEIYRAGQQQQVSTIDAPVSGGDVGAKNGKLSIMIGGDQEAVEAVMPLFEIMGKNIVYQGQAGSGQHTKMCNQITIAGTMIGVCECLLYAHRAGLDLPTMLQSISGGAAACWTLDNLAPRVVNRNFDPGFYVEHFIKDMGIALAEANRMHLALPGLALVKQLYEAVQAQGHGKLGTQALVLGLETLNGTKK